MPNGPAIKLVGVAERVKAVTRIFLQGSVPQHSRKERSMARVFAVRIQTDGCIRVWRYKIGGEQVTSHVTQSFIKGR